MRGYWREQTAWQVTVSRTDNLSQGKLAVYQSTSVKDAASAALEVSPL